jgi:glycosyltransferase involved in cell wall biosynthesis
LEKYPKIRFVIIGDDRVNVEAGFLGYLNSLASDLLIQNEVVFAGFRNDINRVMNALDIVAVPSHIEAFGRVVVEAMAAGKPVVGTDGFGIAEIIENGKTGLLVPPKNPNTLAQALIKLLENPDLREKMGEQGSLAAERFDVVPMTKLHEETYRAVLEKRTETLPKTPYGSPTWL